MKTIGDSKSLWNYTLSPGWTKEEVEVLKIALMKFGVGKWKKIQRSGCLPTKTISQMNLQTQRLLGQQSLAEFMGLHVDLLKIFEDNAQKNGPGILRKNKYIINTGDNLTAVDRAKKMKQNKISYGLNATLVKALRLPKPKKIVAEVLTLEQITNKKNLFSTIEKIDNLYKLRASLESKLQFLAKKKEQRSLYKKSHLKIVLSKKRSSGKILYELNEITTSK